MIACHHESIYLCVGGNGYFAHQFLLYLIDENNRIFGRSISNVRGKCIGSIWICAGSLGDAKAGTLRPSSLKTFSACLPTTRLLPSASVAFLLRSAGHR